MFRIQNNVPEVYPDKSRDFQMFCRLFDVAFNSVKQSIDTMQNITDTKTCDSALLPLLKDKLGFFSDDELSDVELRYILQAFPAIMRYKGSQQALTYITNLYSRLVSSISDSAPVQLQNDSSTYSITVSSEKAVVKTQLLFELLRYVVPAGYTVDYYVTEYHESVSQFYVDNELVYGEGLCLQLVQLTDTSCSFLTNVEDKLCCVIGGTKYHYPEPDLLQGAVKTKVYDAKDPVYTLQLTGDNYLAFLHEGKITHYLTVDSSTTERRLNVVTFEDADKNTLTTFSFDGNKYITRVDEDYFTLGMKILTTKIVIRKDVDSEAGELTNILNSSIIM